MIILNDHLVQSECPECGSSKLDMDQTRGELVCIECGMVIMESGIDLGPEWTKRSDGAQDPSRTGPPKDPWSQGGIQSTVIGWSDRDSYGSSIPMKSRGQIYRLRKWQRRIRHQRTSERNMVKGFIQIVKVSGFLGLPPRVVDEARSIYKRSSEKNLIQGRGIECMVAASIYTACRNFNVPRTLNEISEKSNVDRKEIGRAYRKIARDLDLDLRITTPSDYIHRFCSKLQLNEETIKCCIELVDKAEEMGYLSGKDPVGIAASAIYVASLITGQTRTQGEISEASGITEVTIRKRYKEIIRKLDLRISNGYRSGSA